MNEFWYFEIESREYGSKSFGPYESLDEALEGVVRVMRKFLDSADDTDWVFSTPYKCDPSILWFTLQGEMA
jgi:hypothetical protein